MTREEKHLRRLKLENHRLKDIINSQDERIEALVRKCNQLEENLSSERLFYHSRANRQSREAWRG